MLTNINKSIQSNFSRKYAANGSRSSNIIPDEAYSYNRGSVHPDVVVKIALHSQKPTMGKSARTVNSALNPFFKLLYRFNDYRRFGLMRDDLMLERVCVQEALLRLPLIELEKRTDRIHEANVAFSQHRALSEEEWIPYEEQIPYLSPYVAEVVGEYKAREAFGSRGYFSISEWIDYFKNSYTP